MSYPKVRAKVYRFGDAVAVWIGTGATVYFSPDDWRKISRAGNKAARSVERETFADSPSLTFELEAKDGRRVAPSSSA